MGSNWAAKRLNFSRALLSGGLWFGGFDVIGDIVLIFILQLVKGAFAECAEDFPESDDCV